MQEDIYQQAIQSNLKELFSIERFNPYITQENTNEANAYILYSFNVRLSESFYTSLNCLEILLRNKIHDYFIAKYDAQYFDNSDFKNEIIKKCVRTKKGIPDKYPLENMLKDSRKKLSKKHSLPLETGRIVASLSFGFWSIILSDKCFTDLWTHDLHTIFKKGLNRKEVSQVIQELNDFRNRIAHHEPIIFHNTKTPLYHHHNILQMIDWLSSDMKKWCIHHCSFSNIWKQKPDIRT